MFSPKHKGIITSCIVALGRLPSSIYILIGEFLINPEQVPPDPDTECYHESVSRNVKKYFIFIICSIPIGTILALLFTYQYKNEYLDLPLIPDDSKVPKDETEKPTVGEEEQTTEGEKNEVNNDSGIAASPAIQDEQMQRNLCLALKDLRIWKLVVIGFFTPFIIFLCINTYKIVGSLNDINIKYITFTAFFMSLAYVICGPIWGFCADKVPFKVLYNIINVIGIITGSSIAFTLKFHLSLPFCGLIGLIMVANAGALNVMQTHMMNVYSVKYMMKLGGIAHISNGLSNFLGSILAFILSTYFTGNNNVTGYYILYGIGALLSLISFVIVLFESEDSFWDKIQVEEVISNEPILTVTSEGESFERSKEDISISSQQN